MMLAVVYVFDPLNNKVPPVRALYQSIVELATGVAESVTVPVPVRAAPTTVEMFAGCAFIVKLIILLYAIFGVPALSVTFLL